jgi:hypothetical protein
MEPEGILNAWTTKVRIKRANMTAITAASAYSRTTLFFFILLLETLASKKILLRK